MKLYNIISGSVLIIGVLISYFLPQRFHTINIQTRKKSYIEFSKNALHSVNDAFNISTTPSVLGRAMGLFNVSKKQFSDLADGSLNIHDVGSTIYSIKINTSEITNFEKHASEIHNTDVKIVDITFQPIVNYTEEYLWPVLYEHFPIGSDGTDVNFIGFNMYWGDLRDKLDEMTNSRLLVYSDPILFVSSNTTGLLSFRPIMDENNEINSCIIRGLRPSNFLFDVDIDHFKEEFGSYISMYIGKILLFSSNPNIDIDVSLREDNCEKSSISPKSHMLFCISKLKDKKADIVFISIICSGIILSCLISFLIRMIYIVSDKNRRSEIKSRLIAHVSHELRTPMNVIMGMSELLMVDKNILPTSSMSYIDSIYGAGKTLLLIIDDVLKMYNLESKSITLNYSKINIRTLIHDTLETICKSTPRKNVQLKLSILSGVPVSMVYGDQSKIKCVISNIVSNAIKFTKRGIINIIAETITKDSNIKLKIIVSDTGIGMSKEQIKTIFEPFINKRESNTERQTGTGLAAPICKSLVEIMGGKISYTSMIDQGTTCTFTCMLKKEDSVDIIYGKKEFFTFKENYSPEICIESDIKSKGYSVLVVDDIEVNRKVLCKMLDFMGIETVTCNDGVQSVEKCKKTKFDAIFMDVFMPKLDGIEATKIIRKMSPINKDTPILFVSATVEERYISKCMEAGGNSFIGKPVSMEILQKNIREYL